MKHARRTALGFLAGACCALAIPAVAFAAEDEARQLVQRTLEAMPSSPFVARFTLTGDLRGPRQLLVKHKTVAGERATYLEVVAPEFLVGMRFLWTERVGRPPLQHMRYIATKMPVLISSEMRAAPFLGSTFYLLDVVEPDLNAYTYELVGTDTVGGRACTLVQSRPKEPEKRVYGRIIHTIDPARLIFVRRQFFDHKDQPFKEWTATRIEKIDGHWTVRDQRMKILPRDVESRLQITEITYGAEIPDSVFTKEYLSR